MIDISHKNPSLRVAQAHAIVKVGKQETIDAIVNHAVPKGDVFEMSKAAGLLGVKQTPYLLPDCHPIPIESTQITFQIKELEIEISVVVKTIYKTGVEVEAMHGASIAALNIYDMLKPLDKNVEIHQIKLMHKTGGKSDFAQANEEAIKAVVVVCSDSISAKKKEDAAGLAIINRLEEYRVEISDYQIIPDEKEKIQEVVTHYSGQDIQMIIFTGGTGLSIRDVTPDALEPLIDKRIPGIEEAIRKYGQDRTPFSMLSRSMAGMVNRTLVLALPGSTKGATESMNAIFPGVLHIFKIIDGGTH